jgi:serine/threonine protein kinase
LKPENLLLSGSGESAILKIADFGLSAVIFATETAINFYDNDSNDCTKGAEFDIGNFGHNYNNRYHENKYSTPPRAVIDSQYSVRRLRSLVGSPHYIAPEVANSGK